MRHGNHATCHELPETAKRPTLEKLEPACG